MHIKAANGGDPEIVISIDFSSLPCIDWSISLILIPPRPKKDIWKNIERVCLHARVLLWPNQNLVRATNVNARSVGYGELIEIIVTDIPSVYVLSPIATTDITS